MQKNNLNTLWSKLIIEELIRNGINYFCISPGSRSTPLTAAAALNKNASISMIYDERSSGYHALGYSKGRENPAVIITTSGTAAANLYPSVVEAYYSSIPLLILTADRPPELQEINANQTINQTGLFGKFARWFFNIPCPDINIKPEFILDTIDYAVFQCTKKPGGAVHLNLQFRKPLEPEKEEDNNTLNNENGACCNCEDHRDYIINIKKWQFSSEPYTRYFISPSDTKSTRKDAFYEDHLSLSRVSGIINSTEKGLISIGTINTISQADEILKFTRAFGWPVYADITSGLRLSGIGSNIIRHFDQEVLSGEFNLKAYPETVIHLGGRITSKRFGQFFELYPPENFISVNDCGQRNEFSNANKTKLYIQANLTEFTNKLLPYLGQKINDSSFKDFYELKNEKVQQIIDENCDNDEEINEIFIARNIPKIIADDTCLFLSSSMPVRDMDLYGYFSNRKIRVGSNRGTSGIDGVISAASGFSAGNNRCCTLLIGDQAFIHDLNSLSLLKRLEIPLIIVLINNHGGGIFDFLPVSKDLRVFEKYFVVPHDFSFKGVCETFGLKHVLCKNKKSFGEYYNELCSCKNPAVLEIETSRDYNLRLRKKIKKEILSMLEE